MVGLTDILRKAVGAGAIALSLAASPKIAGAQLNSEPDSLFVHLAQAAKNKPNSPSRSIGNEWGITTSSYIRDLNSGGILYRIIYTDRSYGINGISSASDNRIGKGDELFLIVFHGGAIRYAFGDKNFDGVLEIALLSDMAPESHQISGETPQYSQIFLKKGSEALALAK